MCITSSWHARMVMNLGQVTLQSHSKGKYSVTRAKGAIRSAPINYGYSVSIVN